MIRFDEAACRDLSISARREWLETNGLGGYASSTVSGMNTRRYHGLLVAATKPPAGRIVLLSKIEETLVVNDRRYELSANCYPGAVHPQGFAFLKEFRLDPFPVWVYQIDKLVFEKVVFMVDGRNTTVIQYQLTGGAADCLLELKPLIAFRDYHQTTHENSALDPSLDIREEFVRIAPYSGLPSLFLAHEGGEVRQQGVWYRNFEYDRERERGLDFEEDLFNPFTLVLDLNQNAQTNLIASTAACSVQAAGAMRRSEMERRKTVLSRVSDKPPLVANLTRAAGQFTVARGEGCTVIAGYHWFTDWGRDTMISLPGLALSTGRPELARRILLQFAGSVSEGMLPNRFPDAGDEPEYNTVDATLWFFEAVRAYLAHTGDLDFVRVSLYKVLADIVAWHHKGTRFGIRMDSDGMLLAGEAGTQLTWMDAKIGDWVVTPRQGKPVEIQALWYNALRVMEDLSARLEHPEAAAAYRESAETARSNFEALFWNEEKSCLFDVIDGEKKDGSVRPNQILTMSLFYGLLSPERESAVVECVRRELLTPFGLRTLSPADPGYRGRYEGDPRSRDSAYHEGTV